MDEFFSWFLSFLLLCLILCILGYQIICLTDLETDYVNPYDTAKRINKVVLPEFIAHGVLCLVFLLTGPWFMLAFSLPFLYHNIKLYKLRRHLVDVTEIYNNLEKEKNLRLFKFLYFIFQLTCSIFWLIWINREHMDQ